MIGTKPELTKEHFDAVLFDLDGVLTDTARIHATAWKLMFDEFLAGRSAGSSENTEPFDIDHDYHRYVDGKPRYDGVRDFLASRGIELPEGSRQDAGDLETVCGLGNRKNERVNEALESQGVDVFPGSIELVKRLRAGGIHTAVVSASANCAAVLRSAKIDDLFDARVDGVTLEERGLPGKPAPDSFLEGAKELGVEPSRAVVVEDAISGVEAGRAGRFGLVIGVDRKDNAEALAKGGADVVVGDLAEFLD